MKVTVFSDYVCPFCYMGKASLEKASKDLDIEVEWKAFELRPAGSPPMDEAYRARIEASWGQVQQMGQQFGVDMQTHRFGVDTRLAHRAYKVAQRITPEMAEAFNTALYAAYFTYDQDLSDLNVVLEVAEANGVDRAALQAGLEAGEGEVEVVAEQEYAHAAGITGVPAFVFMDKYLVSGVRPPEQLVAIVQQIKAQEGLT